MSETMHDFEADDRCALCGTGPDASIHNGTEADPAPEGNHDYEVQARQPENLFVGGPDADAPARAAFLQKLARQPLDAEWKMTTAQGDALVDAVVAEIRETKAQRGGQPISWARVVAAAVRLGIVAPVGHTPVRQDDGFEALCWMATEAKRQEAAGQRGDGWAKLLQLANAVLSLRSIEQPKPTDEEAEIEGTRQYLHENLNQWSTVQIFVRGAKWARGLR